MKKIIIMVVFALTACTTLNQNVRPNYKIIDHKGVLAGAKVPKLIQAALTDSAEALSRKYFPDSYVFIANQKGRNLDGLIMWSKNFEVQSEVAKRIQTSVDFMAKSSVSGDKDSITKVMNITTEIVSKQNISGLQMQHDWWIKLKYDDDKEDFQYVAVYAIKKSLLDQFMDDAIKQAAASQENLTDEDNATIAKLKDDLSSSAYGLEDSRGELSEVAFNPFIAESE